MKFPALLLLLILITTTSSARKLASEHAAAGEPLNKSLHGNTSSSLTNLEICGDEEEECLERRAVAEAHLDYIYTQSHKP